MFHIYIALSYKIYCSFETHPLAPAVVALNTWASEFLPGAFLPNGVCMCGGCLYMEMAICVDVYECVFCQQDSQ